MIEVFEEYYPLIDQQIKHIKIYNSGFMKRRCVEMTISSNSTMGEIKEQLIGKLFNNIERLRVFNGEGVEIFEEDLPFLRDQEVLYASSNGADFDSQGSFKEYKILKVLGEGGFGQVMLGKHKLTGQKVAIKILNTSIVGNAEDIDVVFREAQLLQSLNHRNIVKIYRCYTLSNMKVVFVMEYLEGGELLAYVEEQGRLDEEEVKMFTRQIVEAINYCHNQQVIHRDLKLENILLKSRQSKEIKIVDFGISGISTFNADKPNAGSLMYMAPEVLTGKIKKIGPSIDVWGIGVMMYAMLCGTLPFGGESQDDIVQAIVQANPTYTENLSSLGKHLMSKIFQADPNKRIKLIDVLRHPWLQTAAMKEQQREAEIFARRESVLKSGLNTVSSLELIRLYGGVTSLRQNAKTKVQKVVAISPKMSTPKPIPATDSPVNKLTPLQEIKEEKTKPQQNGKLISKRYSKILQIYKAQDLVSKSLTPRQRTIDAINYYGMPNLPSISQVQKNYLKFNASRALQKQSEMNNSSSLPSLH